VKAIVARLAKAKSPVVLPAYTVARYGLQKQLEAFLGATGIPFATLPMGKGIISESNPLYLGMYAGEYSTADVRNAVEGADLVLDLGGEVFPDQAAGGYSCHIQASRMLRVWPDHVEMNEVVELGGRGPATFGPVHMKDLLVALAKEAPRFKTPSFSRPTGIPASGPSSDPVGYGSIFSRVQQFLEPGDILFVDISTAAGYLPAALLPESPGGSLTSRHIGPRRWRPAVYRRPDWGDGTVWGEPHYPAAQQRHLRRRRERARQ